VFPTSPSVWRSLSPVASFAFTMVWLVFGLPSLSSQAFFCFFVGSSLFSGDCCVVVFPFCLSSFFELLFAHCCFLLLPFSGEVSGPAVVFFSSFFCSIFLFPLSPLSPFGGPPPPTSLFFVISERFFSGLSLLFQTFGAAKSVFYSVFRV